MSAPLPALHPVLSGFSSSFVPKTRMTVSEWADKYRILPQAGAAQHGQWHTDRAPYLREVQDALSARSRAEEVVVIKGTQLGFTEVWINWGLSKIDLSPGPMLTILPTELVAKRLSKQRLSPSLTACERTSGRFVEKSRDSSNTLLQKDYPGGSWILGGANSPSALSSMPIGDLVCDEIDRYPVEAGDEGDPIDLAIQRISNFPRAKVFYLSSPTSEKLSRIWKLYLDSDRRVYEVPCPHCNAMHTLEFENLKWPKGQHKEAVMHCPACGSEIQERWKTQMLRDGQWRATNPGHWRCGFEISSLYSPLGWLSWEKVARRFEAAEGDPVKIKTFENTILGKVSKESGIELSKEFLDRRREEYFAQVPEGVLLLTLAVDVQKDRLECEVVGWGKQEESWGISCHILRGDPSVLSSGDPSNPSVWEMLTQLRRSEFFRANQEPMRIVCTVIDSGGHHTDEVYRYCKPLERVRVYAIKGSSRTDGPIISKPTRSNRIGCPLYVLNVHKLKDIVFGRLKIDPEKEFGAGVCHFPMGEDTGYDAAHYAGLMSERLIERQINGQKAMRYEKKAGMRNEPLDLRVYGTAAIRFLNPKWNALADIRAERSVKKPAALPPQRRSTAPAGGFDFDGLMARLGLD